MEKQKIKIVRKNDEYLSRFAQNVTELRAKRN